MLYILSFFIVAFGQPALYPFLGLIASSVGYALFFISLDSSRKRFWKASIWFALVQLVQLYWFVSHPYNYIYPVWILVSLALGFQFGWLSVLATRKRVSSLRGCLFLSSLWVFLEWSRLWFLSGFSWNPVGLALASHLFPLQAASLAGVYGLSFLVMFINLLFYRAYLGFGSYKFAASAFMLPFIFGFFHVKYHEADLNKSDLIHALLVQTSFPIEETVSFQSLQDQISYVEGEWKQILRALSKHRQEKVDLIALPEYVVPFGTYTPVFSADRVVSAFKDIYEDDIESTLPSLEVPYSQDINGRAFVTNGYYAQALANIFQTDVVAGFEDADQVEKGFKYYNAALFFKPDQKEDQSRYEKRVLVPMGEYIPFSYFQKLALSYGVSGSFTCGSEAKVFSGKVPFGVSICYEETYPNYMRDNKVKGAQLLVNLTSDVWYPNSSLPRQHMEHGRLRSVESGYPMLRACNTGVTCSIDSLGRTVDELNGDDPEWTQGVLKTDLPLYHYKTLYSLTGDKLILWLSFGFIASFLFSFGLRAPEE